MELALAALSGNKYIDMLLLLGKLLVNQCDDSDTEDLAVNPRVNSQPEQSLA
jgi:hypothetical protein